MTRQRASAIAVPPSLPMLFHLPAAAAAQEEERGGIRRAIGAIRNECRLLSEMSRNGQPPRLMLVRIRDSDPA